jgi:hypothetical protein
MHMFTSLLSAFWGSGYHLQVRAFYSVPVIDINTVNDVHIEPPLPHPHPAAPQDIVSRFNNIAQNGHHLDPTLSHPKTKLATKVSAGSTSYNEFWDAPSRFWAPSRTLGEVEVQAVLVSVPFINVSLFS